MTDENKKKVDFIEGILLDNLGGIKEIENTNISYLYKLSQTLLNFEKAKADVPKIMNWGNIVTDNGELIINEEEDED